MISSDIPWNLQIFNDIFRYSMISSDITWNMKRYQDIKDIKRYQGYQKIWKDGWGVMLQLQLHAQYYIVLYNTIQYNALQLFCIVFYCIVLHCIVLYCIVFHWPTPLEDIKRYQKIMLLQQLLQQRPPLNYSPLNRGLKSTGHNFEKKIKSPRVHHRIGIWKMHTRGF